MIKARLRFVKESTAKYISHLDLMHTMQRIFIRSGIAMRHTEGFNPHPYMSIILPLSVGHESECELMDFDIVNDSDMEIAVERFNAAAPQGISAVEVYPRETKGADIKWLLVSGVFTYDNGADDETLGKLRGLFSKTEMIIKKKTKHGEAELNLIPNISRISFSRDGSRILAEAVISAQEPSINPDSIVAAIYSYAPEIAPDFAEFRRIKVFDKNMHEFR